MSGRTYGITRQTADALATVRAAIEAGHLPVDPMAAVILKDVEDATREFAKNAAIVRIRIVNKGTPPSAIAKRERAKRRRPFIGPTMNRSDAGHISGTQPRWSEEEMDLLAKLWRDGSLSKQEIAERIGRSRTACHNKALALGLSRGGARPHPERTHPAFVHENKYTKRPLLRAVRLVHERRRDDAERLRGFA